MAGDPTVTQAGSMTSCRSARSPWRREQFRPAATPPAGRRPIEHEHGRAGQLRESQAPGEVGHAHAPTVPVGLGSRKLPCAAVFRVHRRRPRRRSGCRPNIARDAKGFVLTGPTSSLRPVSRWIASHARWKNGLPGVLAAGDIRRGPFKRVGFAVGDGPWRVTLRHRLISINR